MKIDDVFNETMYEGIVQKSDDIDYCINFDEVKLRVIRESRCYYSAYYAGHTIPVWNLIGRFYYGESDFNGCN